MNFIEGIRNLLLPLVLAAFTLMNVCCGGGPTASSVQGAVLTIDTSSLPGGTAGTPYSATLTASGGTQPYTWSITSGALAKGLTLSATSGVISGTPAVTGQFAFTVSVKDSSPRQQAAHQALSVSVVALTPLMVDTSSLPGGTTNSAYLTTLDASGGRPAYTWSTTSGQLPPGLALTTASGTISGIPSKTGTFNFTVQVADSSTPPQTANKQMGISITQGTASLDLLVVGDTTSTSYPVTNGSLCIGCPMENGSFSVLSRKVGSTLLPFSTYLGGGNAPYRTQLRSIWVDPSSGDVFIGGRTGPGTGFPTTPGVFQPNYAGGADDAVLCRYSSSGMQKWCSFLGTSGSQIEETVYGIGGLDSNGTLAICGRINSMPGQNTIDGVPWTKIGPVPANQDTSYIAKVKGDGSALVWLTSFGGSNTGEGIRGRCTLDAAGNVYAGGESGSTDFPTTAGVFQPTNRSGAGQGVVVKMKADGSAFVWASYIGGTNSSHPYDNADGGIVLDANNNVLVCGAVKSTDLFPNGTPGYQTTMPGPGDSVAYIAKIKADGTQILAGTYLGGAKPNPPTEQHPECNSIALDAGGNVIVAGETGSTSFPTIAGAFQTTNQGKGDATVSKLSSDLMTLIASTYVGGSDEDSGDHSGGIGFDADGNIYSMIGTRSNNFPVTTDAYQGSYIGNGISRNIAIFGLNPDMTTLVYGTYLGGAVQAGDSDGTWPWALALTH